MKDKLKKEVEEYLKDQSDLFDFDAYYDSNLSYSENKSIIFDKINKLFGYKEEITKGKIEEDKLRENVYINKLKEEFKTKSEEDLYKDQTNTLIIGKKGSAKTTLAWSLADKIRRLSNRKIYIFNHPRPEILKNLPFEVVNVNRLEALYTITDGIVLIDEAHEIFNVIDKKINNKLKILLSRSRQNNTCFIFICHNSYFINRCLFSFIDVRIIKEVNDMHYELERIHIKKLYEDVHVFGKENFYIDSDYIKGYNSFIKPVWFSEELSNAYRYNPNKCDFFN